MCSLTSASGHDASISIGPTFAESCTSPVETPKLQHPSSVTSKQSQQSLLHHNLRLLTT